MAQSTVADNSPAVAAMAADWALADALMGGTRAMRAAGETYLPKWPNEDPESYKTRLAKATLFPAYKRTVQTLTGKPFSKAITVGEDVPARIKEWLKDVDLEGRNLDVFAAELTEGALSHGLGGILVDHPPAVGVRTLADERAAGLRPYWVHIRPGALLGWRAARVNGAWVIKQLRFMEAVQEDDGEFGVKTIQQVRVLEPGSWQTHRKNEKGDWALHDKGETSLKYVPFVPVYGERVAFMVGCPPLRDMAFLNVEHWQSASDQQTILHVARVPILLVEGAEDAVGSDGKVTPWTMTIGAASAVRVPKGGDMKYVEHQGHAIEAGQQSLDKLEERMRQAGAELLVLEPGKITATQVATENAVGMCALQRIVLGAEDALNAALQMTADWVKEANGGTVKVFNDFGAATLAEASAQLLLSMNQAGKLSDETLFGEVQRRGIVAADVDWEEERGRIEEQGPPLGGDPDPDDDPPK